MALRSIIAQRDGNFCDEKCRYKWICPCSWKNQLEVGESQFSGQRETLTMRSLLAGFTKSCGTKQSALPCRIIINWLCLFLNCLLLIGGFISPSVVDNIHYTFHGCIKLYYKKVQASAWCKWWFASSLRLLWVWESGVSRSSTNLLCTCKNGTKKEDLLLIILFFKPNKFIHIHFSPTP